MSWRRTCISRVGISVPYVIVRRHINNRASTFHYAPPEDSNEERTAAPTLPFEHGWVAGRGGTQKSELCRCSQPVKYQNFVLKVDLLLFHLFSYSSSPSQPVRCGAAPDEKCRRKPSARAALRWRRPGKRRS